MTLERNGLFDVSVHKILMESDLQPETIFECLLTIPGTSFSAKADSMYLKGQGKETTQQQQQKFLAGKLCLIMFFCYLSHSLVLYQVRASSAPPPSSSKKLIATASSSILLLLLLALMPTWKGGGKDRLSTWKTILFYEIIPSVLLYYTWWPQSSLEIYNENHDLVSLLRKRLRGGEKE